MNELVESKAKWLLIKAASDSQQLFEKWDGALSQGLMGQDGA